MSNRKIMLTVMSIMLVVVTLVLVSSSTLAQDGVTLRFASADDANGQERTTGILNAFTAETGIEVVWEQMDGANDPAILVQMAAGTAPDVIQAGELALQRFALADEGGFMDLTPMMEGDEDFRADMFFDTVWATGVIDDAVYAITKDFATTAYYVNVDMFEEAGLDLPEEGWTYDDLLDVALELTLDGNGNNAKSPDFDAENIVRYGWYVPHDWVRGWAPLLYSFGSTMMNDEGTMTTGHINSAETVAALDFYRQASLTHHVTATVAAIDAQPGVDLFGSGQAAIRGPRGPWHVTSYSENPDINVATVPMPAGEAGRYSVICWAGFGVYAGSDHPEEAYQLVRYLGTVGQETYVLHALSANIEINDAAGYAEDPLRGAFVTEIEHLHPLDATKTADFSECVELPLKDVLVLIQSDGGLDIDLQEMMDDFAAEADECLSGM
jgi:multiple sugar transport system substrate-binding protein